VGRLLSDLRWVSRAAVAHEAVIESLLGSADALVPMKLFTLFTNDARALEETRSNWGRVERALRRVARHVEWGVRLTVDERRLAPPAAVKRADSGLGYLRAKQRLHAAASTSQRRISRRAAGVFRTLSALATHARRREIAAAPAEGRRMLVDAAFLVPRGRSARFRAAVKRQARELADNGYRLQLTGPWPPYSFVGDRQ
jgi:hypothetical protein